MMSARKDDEQEMSMEEILASIRKYVTEDGTPHPSTAVSTSPEEIHEEVLDLKHVGASIIDHPMDPLPQAQPEQTPVSAPAAHEQTSPPEPAAVPSVSAHNQLDSQVSLSPINGHKHPIASMEEERQQKSTYTLPSSSEPPHILERTYSFSAPASSPPLEVSIPHTATPVSLNDSQLSFEGNNLTSQQAMTASASALSRLVETTKTAQEAAFSSLSASMQKHSFASQGDSAMNQGLSTTLESLTIQAMAPMVKTWLDANLPTLVESLVQKEIERITADLLNK